MTTEINTLIYANIGNEIAWIHRNRPSYTLPQLVQQMRRDLWVLPLWCKESNEYILAPDNYSPLHPLLINEEEFVIEEKCAHSWKGEISLWGPEPTLQKKISGAVFRNPVSESSLEPLMNRMAGVIYFSHYNQIETEAIAITIENTQQLDGNKTHWKGGWVLKKPYTSSGRGIFFLSDSKRIPNTIHQCITHSSHLIAEPFLAKEEDWAAEYFIAPDHSIRFMGLSHFATNSTGQYLYSILSSRDRTIGKLLDVIHYPVWEQVQKDHLAFLSNEVAPYYSGYVGIDMLTYRHSIHKTMALHPFVELNLRYTMGAYALDLYKHFDNVLPEACFSVCSLPREQVKRNEWLKAQGKQPKRWEQVTAQFFKKNNLLLNIPEERSTHCARLSALSPLNKVV